MRPLKQIFLVIGMLLSISGSAQNGFDPNFGNNGLLKQVIGKSYTGCAFTPMSLQKDAQYNLYAFGSATINGKDYFIASKWLANGKIDSSYGGNGFLLMDITGIKITTNPIIQADGKLVIAGYTRANAKNTLVLNRFLANGQADASFGTNGQGSYTLSYLDDTPVDMAMQADGKFLVISNNLIDQSIFTLRILSNGNLDSSFNLTGKINSSFASSQSAKKILVQPDGKIIVAGNFQGSKTKVGLIRFLGNGQLDSAFGSNGSLQQSIGSGNDLLIDLCLGNNNTLCALTSSSIGNATCAFVQWNGNGSLNSNFGIAGVKPIGYPVSKFLIDAQGNAYLYNNNKIYRHTADGNLDSSFGANASYNFMQNPGDAFYSMCMTNGAELRLLGRTNNLNNYDLLLHAIDSNGALLNYFGSNGKVKAAVSDSVKFEKYTGTVCATLALPNGSLMVASSLSFLNQHYLFISKFLPNGQKDFSFGNKGVLDVKFAGNPSYAYCRLAFGQDQKIIVAAVAQFGTSSPKYVLQVLKIDQTGIQDQGFASNGMLLDSTFTNYGISLAMQQTGKFILAWKTLNRYNSNGSIDNSFSSSSINTNDPIYSLFTLRNNKVILVKGAALTRINENGSADPSFGTNGAFVQYHTGADTSVKAFHSPISLCYEKPGNRILVSYYWHYAWMTRTQPTPNKNEWVYMDEDGHNAQSVFLKDSVFQIPNQVALPNQNFLLLSPYYVSNSNTPAINHLGVMKKLLANGKIDSSFANKGSFYGEQGILPNSNPVMPFFETVETMPNSKFWHIRNVNDTLYFTNIVQEKNSSLLINANKQNIGFGDTIQLSADAYQGILNYKWQIPGNKFRYVGGTDSSSASPLLQFTGTGNYSISLQALLADTNLSSTKNNYITLSAQIDFSANSTSIKITDTATITPNFNGHPIKVLWQISPNNFSFTSGTDSTTAIPRVLFNKYNQYDVQLTLTYADTIVSLLKPRYIWVMYVGLNQLAENAGIKIFPNPSRDHFYLEGSAERAITKCTLMDTEGRIIETIHLLPNEQNPINLPAANGLYLLRLEDKNGNCWFSRIVKE